MTSSHLWRTKTYTRAMPYQKTKNKIWLALLKIFNYSLTISLFETHMNTYTLRINGIFIFRPHLLFTILCDYFSVPCLSDTFVTKIHSSCILFLLYIIYIYIRVNVCISKRQTFRKLFSNIKCCHTSDNETTF